MPLDHSPARQRRKVALIQEIPGSDPILTLPQCAAELGMTRPTFWRSALPYLETVRLSPQRRGVRRSVLEEFKRARTRPAARQLEEATAK
jgi:hypothetical protein